MRAIFFLVICMVLFQGCDNQASDDLTVFSGMILFADTMEPAGNVDILFVAFENFFPGTNSVEVINVRTPIDTEDGAFEARFEEGLGIDEISITVSVFRSDNTFETFVEPEDGLFCNGGDCFGFEPGIIYDNMVILVPRLED